MAGKMGEWSFLIGFVLAIVFGLLTKWVDAGTLTLVLVVLGLIVGFLNISDKEATPFLVAVAALMITAGAGATLSKIPPVFLGTFLQNAVTNIGVLVAPAAIVVAIKAIHSLAKD